MSTTTLFKPCGIGNFEWLRMESAAARADRGAEPVEAVIGSFSVGDAERLVDECGSDSMLLIAPAEKVSFLDVAFEPSEKKLLRQTVPYTLEEELVDDVDELHFALGDIADNAVDVAVVRRDALEQWQQSLAEQQLDVQGIVPELMLLPLPDKCWTLLINDEQWLVRYGVSAGFAMEPDNASLALQLLLDEVGGLPSRLLVFAGAGDRVSILNQLPELLRGVVDWQEGDYWAIVSRGFQQSSRPINLLQGEYAQGLPWKKWWKQWKLGLIFLLAAIVLNILMTAMRIQVLEGRNLELRTETEKIYRSVVPRGAVMDPARQLRRKVESMQGSGGEGFVSLLAKVAKVLAAVDGLQVQSINYDEKQSELRLTILANGFNDVETARANLEKAGLTAELTGSNAEGDKNRARLRIRG